MSPSQHWLGNGGGRYRSVSPTPAARPSNTPLPVVSGLLFSPSAWLSDSEFCSPFFLAHLRHSLLPRRFALRFEDVSRYLAHLFPFTYMQLVPIGSNITVKPVLVASVSPQASPLHLRRSQSPQRTSHESRYPAKVSFPPLLLVKHDFFPASASHLYLPAHSVVKTISSDLSGWGFGTILEGLPSGRVQGSKDTGWFPHANCTVPACPPIACRSHRLS